LRAIRAANGIVDTAVLIAILLLLAVGGYALWDSGQVYEAADAARYEKYRPAEEGESLSFEELRRINPDVFAWLTVFGTHIDYPVVQGPDNMKYVNTDAEGNYSLSGAIFLDSGCSRDFSDLTSILYGHHMEKEVLFGEIGLFADRGYFEARKYGTLYYGGRYHGLEFFAFLQADAYDGTVFRTGIRERTEQTGYLANLLGKALYARETLVSADDHIVLLSTCSPGPTNGRDILVGRITDGLYADPFAESGDVGAAGPLPGGPGSLLRSLPPWTLIAALIALTALLAVRIRRRKRKEQEGNGGEGSEPGPQTKEEYTFRRGR
jgi:sortase B